MSFNKMTGKTGKVVLVLNKNVYRTKMGFFGLKRKAQIH